MAWNDEHERMAQDLHDRVHQEVNERLGGRMRRGRVFIGGRGPKNCCGTGGGLAWGAVLVLIGTVLLLDHMGILDARQLWKFWPLLLIVAGLMNFFQTGRRAWGAALLTLGVLFQLDTLGVAHFRWVDLWPLALIFAGIFIIWGSIEARNALGRMGVDGGDPRSTLNENVIFGGIERRVNSKQFRGGQLHAVFGGIEIRVPETWYVASRGQGIFGGFTDATRYRGVEDSTNPHRKTLIVKGASVFGGVEIRN